MSQFNIIRIEYDLTAKDTLPPEWAVLEKDAPFAHARGVAYCHTREDAVRVKASLENAGKPVKFAGTVSDAHLDNLNVVEE